MKTRAILYAIALCFLAACANNTNIGDTDAGSQSLSGKADQIQDGVSSDTTEEEEMGDSTEEEEMGDSTADAAPVIDPFAPAHDVDLHHVVFSEDLQAPDYDYPRVDSGFFLSGTEFWQKWSGGLNPTYSYSEGSDFGRRCMYASALRFKALMADPPESIVTLREESKWGGSFFNWNDDYSLSTWGDGSSARLWAWRTTLIKWISQTNVDGSCYLPTKSMIETLAANCLDYAESGEGSIQGCRAP